MIVPHYWAEVKLKKRIKGRQVTVKRFGWSNLSEEEALQHAKSRANEAIAALEAGKKTFRNEPKVAYNGAEGVPIREEIIEEKQDWVITRNSYGALCLNTPDVLFADIDFETTPNTKLYLFSFFLTLSCLFVPFLFFPSFINFVSTISNEVAFFGVALLSLLLILVLTFPVAGLLFKLFNAVTDGVEKTAKNRIYQFAKNHPDWHLRLYRTPAGYRVLVMHKTFDPNAQETQDFFKALETDPIYVQMCKNQHCFRARVSPKPWRIGMETHIKPRPGLWPVHPDRILKRQKWIENYEQRARKYAACQFEEKLGSNIIHSKAEQVRAIHDKYCKATAHLPIA